MLLKGKLYFRGFVCLFLFLLFLSVLQKPLHFQYSLIKGEGLKVPTL